MTIATVFTFRRTVANTQQPLRPDAGVGRVCRILEVCIASGDGVRKSSFAMRRYVCDSPTLLVGTCKWCGDADGLPVAPARMVVGLGAKRTTTLSRANEQHEDAYVHIEEYESAFTCDTATSTRTRQPAAGAGTVRRLSAASIAERGVALFFGSRRNAQRIQSDIQRRAVRQERHILLREDAGNDALVAVAVAILSPTEILRFCAI